MNKENHKLNEKRQSKYATLTWIFKAAIIKGFHEQQRPYLQQMKNLGNLSKEIKDKRKFKWTFQK